MVSSDKLPPSRKKLLTESGVPAIAPSKVSDKTRLEMEAGRWHLKVREANDKADAGRVLLVKRYHNSEFDVYVDPFQDEENWLVRVSVYKKSMYVVPVRKPIFEEAEPLEDFLSDTLLTKIIMVCG